MLLNGQSSPWSSVQTDFPQVSILNDVPDNLELLFKLFVEDTSLFSTLKGPSLSARLMNDNLNKFSGWIYERKLLFNPDLTKQAQEVFSRETIEVDRQTTFFNNGPVVY